MEYSRELYLKWEALHKKDLEEIDLQKKIIEMYDEALKRLGAEIQKQTIAERDLFGCETGIYNTTHIIILPTIQFCARYQIDELLGNINETLEKINATRKGNE